MSEKNKAEELNDQDLDKVSGGRGAMQEFRGKTGVTADPLPSDPSVTGGDLGATSPSKS